MSAVEEEMDRLGLHELADRDLYPVLIRDNDEAWLTIVVDGRRVRLCKVSWGRLLNLCQEAAGIAATLGPR